MAWNFIETAWRGLMDEKVNPLRRLPRASAHMILLTLSWMWSAIFSFALGSYLVFGISAAGHTLVVTGTFITVAAFQAVSQGRAQDRARKRLNHIWSTTSPV